MSFPLPPKLRRRTTDFVIGKEVLGEGSLCLVHPCVEKASGSRFALKAFDRATLRSSKKEADVTMEEHCLRRLNHPSVALCGRLFKTRFQAQSTECSWVRHVVLIINTTWYQLCKSSHFKSPCGFF
ncbi:unnamed protein product [Polarella glacialis]|uniref:Protein kinase domain-containing protein n=1 Tax=Polarella glacialis TaxID=89957 RepID=A0A813JYZ8_POLGL|nr:unnamed protein product [Polarella glacialis]